MDADALNLYYLARNVQFRYDLDKFEAKHIAEMLRAYAGARRSILKKLDGMPLASGEARFTQARAAALLDETYAMTAGMRQRLGQDIGDVSVQAGGMAFQVHNDILSVGGLVPDFSFVSLAPAQVRALVVDTPIGGRLLSGWVDKSFDHHLRQDIKGEMEEGLILGEGYGGLVKRIEEGFVASRREAVTLARTYVQNVNTSAQEAVYASNKDIVKGVKWCAVLEPGYSKSGHGTCLRCAALDGQQFTLDDHPPVPLHPNCRCLLLPVTKSWQELGIPLPELEDAVRPYTMRPPENIDAGGRRTILETGFHRGDYAAWFEKQSAGFQKNVLGPRRYELWARGDLSFKDLVDRDGNMLTLKQLQAGATTGTAQRGGPIPSQ